MIQLAIHHLFQNYDVARQAAHSRCTQQLPQSFASHALATESAAAAALRVFTLPSCAGAGKSSIVSALLRLRPIQSGFVIVHDKQLAAPLHSTTATVICQSRRPAY
jgi:ABC-type enterochelin transport system ATPase subunit